MSSINDYFPIGPRRAFRKPKHKTCKTCGLERVSSDFRSGRFVCRNCTANVTKRYCYRLRTEIMNHYGQRCRCCGETDDKVLCIDHVFGGGSREREGGERINVRTFMLNIIRDNFPDRYQILCHNCNWAKHVNNNKMPQWRIGLNAKRKR